MSNAASTVARHLRENESMRYSFHGEPRADGKYCVALAMRAGDAIVTGVIEFDYESAVPMLVVAVIDAVTEGRDPLAAMREMRMTIEKVEQKAKHGR